VVVLVPSVGVVVVVLSTAASAAICVAELLLPVSTTTFCPYLLQPDVSYRLTPLEGLSFSLNASLFSLVQTLLREEEFLHLSEVVLVLAIECGRTE
jgi:hypothetical protein